jgi:peptidoglycan/LPS O-acetylase OafA/YrhL
MKRGLAEGWDLFARCRIDAPQSAYLDAWRGLSAIVVLFAHMEEFFLPRDRFIISPLAGGAVMVFFVLSGFFIHKSLAGVFASRHWDSYVRARINRIIPPFAFCLALTVLLWLAAPHFFATGSREFVVATARSAYSLHGLPETALFVNPFTGSTLSANGALWSLSYEVWYYVLAGLFALWFSRNRWGLVGAPLLLLLAALQPWFAVYGVLWAGGAFVSVLHANGRLPASRLPLWPIPVALYAALHVAPPWLLGELSMLFHLSCGAWFAWHMAHALQRDTHLQFPWLQRSAGFSYTLYVIHFPLLLFAYGISPSPLMGVAAAIIVLALAAVIGPGLERLAPAGRRRLVAGT